MSETYALGVNIIFKDGDTVIGGQRDVSLNVEVEEIDLTSKDDVEALTNILFYKCAQGLLKWGGDCNGVVCSGTGGPLNLLGDILGGQGVLKSVEFELGLTGAKAAGDILITKWALNAGTKEPTYSTSYRGSGPLVYTPPTAPAG
ncbi:MAG TPA: hypothetical protein VGL77_13670 [Armatimonadota bacterium]|jgi:hypothetical protein